MFFFPIHETNLSMSEFLLSRMFYQKEHSVFDAGATTSYTIWEAEGLLFKNRRRIQESKSRALNQARGHSRSGAYVTTQIKGP